MENPIIKGFMCIPEEKKKAVSPSGVFPTPKATFKPLVESELEKRLEVYKAAAVRLKGDIPKNDALTIIDAYNKGMLYELEQVIADLESLLNYTK